MSVVGGRDAAESFAVWADKTLCMRKYGWGVFCVLFVGGEIVRPCNVSNNQRYFACICVVCGRNVVIFKRKMYGKRNTMTAMK